MGHSAPGDQYEVVIVKYGTRVGTRSGVYLNYHIYETDDAPIGMDYFVWVVRNAERTVIVDTGYSRHGGEVRKRTTLIEPAAAYAALGIDTAAGHDVVITHAHYDHAGNVDLFDASDVILSRSEYEFWTSAMAERAQFAYSAEDDDIATLRRAHDEGRIRTFDGRIELAPGITLIEVGGHTPGQAIVVVSTAEGEVVLASDAVHYYEECDADIPFAFVADLPAMYGGFDLIRGIVEERSAHLVSGHDPDTLSRFTPVTEGPLAGLAATIGSPAAT